MITLDHSTRSSRQALTKKTYCFPASPGIRILDATHTHRLRSSLLGTASRRCTTGNGESDRVVSSEASSTFSGPAWAMLPGAGAEILCRRAVRIEAHTICVEGFQPPASAGAGVGQEIRVEWSCVGIGVRRFRRVIEAIHLALVRQATQFHPCTLSLKTNPCVQV